MYIISTENRIEEYFEFLDELTIFDFADIKQPNMGGYAEDNNDEEPQRRGFNFFGTDVSKIPCFKHSFMYAIGSGTAAGVIYNLALSRNPMKLAFGTYTAVLFGYYALCRYE